jgi:UDP-N-acetylglucosamine 2-epimerase
MTEQAQSNFDSMFGTMNLPEEVHIVKQEMKEVHIMPKMLPLTIHEQRIREQMEKAQREKKWVLTFVIGTKPCFYKFYGSIMEAERQGIPYMVIDSNQHYDANLTFGIKEFDYSRKICSNLSIRGNLSQKSGELFYKVSWFANYLKNNWPDVTVVPVVLGDTILTSIVPAAWMFTRREKAIHNEAGLRSMSPDAMALLRNHQTLSAEDFIDKQFNGSWSLQTQEPFPEQWDTFVSSKGSEFLFAPLDLNKQHLLREGHNEKKIWVTGGVVVDALEAKSKMTSERSVFDIYPILEQGEWIRVDIHRKANQTPERFKSIISGIKQLVEKGHQVNFIEMNTTRVSLDQYGLRGVLDGLKNYDNFLHTSVWPEFSHVLEFYKSKNCFAALTDSGGVQEEMNLLGKLCLTARFNTDRPETVNSAHSNILVPPVSGDFMLKMVEHVLQNQTLQQKMRSAPKLYGEGVGKKFITTVKGLMEQNAKPFTWTHDQWGLL